MNILNLKKSYRGLSLSAAVALSAAIATAPAAEAANFTLNFDESADGSSLLYNADGTLNTSQWTSWGLTDISGMNNRQQNGQPRVAKFNTYNTDDHQNRADPDLRTGSSWGTESQGNVLIIQEDKSENFKNGRYIADDEEKGGYIDFKFANSVAFKSFSLLDIDDNGKGIKIEGYDSSQQKILNIDVDTLLAEHAAKYKTTNSTSTAAAQGTSVSMNGVTLTQLGTKRGDNSLYKFDIDEAFLANIRFTYPGSGAISELKWDTQEDGPREIPEPSAIGGLLMVGFVGARRFRKQSSAKNA
ncbi:MAG: PEP-CTERM sorting domain-containing protein [Phormidesmis sp.]